MSSSIQVEFNHILRLANTMAEEVAKQGVGSYFSFCVVFHLQLLLVVFGIILIY